MTPYTLDQTILPKSVILADVPELLLPVEEPGSSKLQMAVSLQRYRSSMVFTQYSCSAQPELLKDRCILYALATKMENRSENSPVHFLIEGRCLII